MLDVPTVLIKILHPLLKKKIILHPSLLFFVDGHSFTTLRSTYNSNFIFYSFRRRSSYVSKKRRRSSYYFIR